MEKLLILTRRENAVTQILNHMYRQVLKNVPYVGRITATQEKGRPLIGGVEFRKPPEVLKVV